MSGRKRRYKLTLPRRPKVPCQSCISKEEEITHLMDQNNELKEVANNLRAKLYFLCRDEISEEDVELNTETSGDCKVCFESNIRTLFRPCNHSVCCVGCALNLRRNSGDCPVCRHSIRQIIKVYR